MWSHNCGMSAEGSFSPLHPSPLRPSRRLCPELGKLASAHAAVGDAIGRMIGAIAAGRETLIGIERLRLQTAVDQYRTWATDIIAVLEASDEDVSELRLRLSQMQSEFRAEIERKAAELASAC